MSGTFRFLKPGRLVDGDLELVLARQTPADPGKHHVPGYEFEMRRPGEAAGMGAIRLRIGPAAALRFAGHIGYEVKPRFRGRRYAARSCMLLAPLARAHGLSAVWLTVDPKNIPSIKTCEALGARHIETVRVPKTHPMYAHGARHRRRYRWELRGRVLSPDWRTPPSCRMDPEERAVARRVQRWLLAGGRRLAGAIRQPPDQRSEEETSILRGLRSDKRFSVRFLLNRYGQVRWARDPKLIGTMFERSAGANEGSVALVYTLIRKRRAVARRLPGGLRYEVGQLLLTKGHIVGFLLVLVSRQNVA